MSEDERKMDLEKNSGPAESDEAAERREAKAHAAKERRDWLVHTVAFLIGQGVLWAMGACWLVYRIKDEPIPEEERGLLMWIGRIWLTIWVIDTVWSWSYTVFPRTKRKAGSAS